METPDNNQQQPLRPFNAREYFLKRTHNPAVMSAGAARKALEEFCKEHHMRMPMLEEEFAKEMEELFGTEEAFGIYFEAELAHPEVLSGRISIKDYEALCIRLGKDMPSCSSHLGNGGSAVCCTHYAKFIYDKLPGRVKIYGFHNEDNPDCEIVKRNLHPGGHDFAIVDDMYIVDPWPRFVRGDPFKKMVFPVNDLSGLTRRIYGLKKNWKRMEIAEKSCLW